MPKFTSVICAHYWVVITVCEQILVIKGIGAGCKNGGRIRVDKAAGNGVVVAGASQVKAGLGIKEVAAVAEGVEVGYMGSVRGNGIALSVQNSMIAPGVVFILIEEIAVFVNYPYYISLKVLDIVVIFRTVFVACNRIIFIEKGHAADRGIGIDELTVVVDVAVGCTVDGLRDADAGGIVGVGIGIGSLSYARKPASGFPVKGHAVTVLGGIAYLIVDYTIPVKVSQ